jgi:predicted nucleic acid-binding protein
VVKMSIKRLSGCGELRVELTSLSAAIGKVGGLLKRDYGKSHGVGLADAIVAATAEAENAELKTLHTKHYPMLKGLKPAYLK